MRIALAQINPTVGDLPGNADKIIAWSQDALDQHCTAAIFPELALLGYPPKDLLLKRDFVEESLRQLDRIAAHTRGLDVLVGYAEPNRDPSGRPLHNAVALLRGGEVVSRHFKTLLPTYDVFDESRYFEPGPNDERNNVIDFTTASVGSDESIPVGVSICEDLWNDERLISRRLYHTNPIRDLHQHGAKLLVNASASPFVVGKHEFRHKLFASQTKAVGVPLLYVNQVGGNDELVFDGASCAFNDRGECVAQAKAFEEDLLVVDFAGSTKTSVQITGEPPRMETVPGGIASMHDALVLGTRDYLRKCGFGKVVLGLSGGIDSALTCAIAREALGPENVTGVAMPSKYSSDHSVSDAEQLAINCGMTEYDNYHVVPIKPMHDAYADTLEGVVEMTGLTEENLQARIRGATLMSFSNKTGALLLTTGNKSELAVGYCTLYGDMCGGLAVISDVPKTQVTAMCRWINEQAGREIVPENTITKPPSAELAPDQKDSDSLPAYDELDRILEMYIEDDASAATIVEAGHDEEMVAKVLKLVDRSEFKRRQAAPGLKVTSRAFGFGRRMPIAQRYSPMLTWYGTPAPAVVSNA